MVNIKNTREGLMLFAMPIFCMILVAILAMIRKEKKSDNGFDQLKDWLENINDN